MLGISNVLIEGAYSGSIVCDGNTIFGAYKQGEALPENVKWLDGQGSEAYPAGINPHVHDRPDQPEKEDVPHLEAACIAGGYGTIMTMPNTAEGIKWPHQIGLLALRWQNSPLTVKFHLGAGRDNLGALRLLKRPRYASLGGVKLYMEETTNPSMMIDDAATQRKVCEANAQTGSVTLVHVGAQEWLERSKQRLSIRSHLDHCILRHSKIEIEGTRRILEINREVGGAMHICHVSTPRSVELIRGAQDRGQNITCETDPKYWRISCGRLISDGGFAQVNPSPRTIFEMAGIEQALCRGNVTFIADDHAPHEADKKRLAYPHSPSGLPGVQTTMLLTYELKQQGKISPQRYIELTSLHAARRFGLNKGKLGAGYDADIILINPSRNTLFTNESMHYKCGWTPYHGTQVSAGIDLVVLKGQVVRNTLPGIL